MASAAGGMEIEEVAKERPEAILREAIRPETGFEPYHARKIAFGLDLPLDLVGTASKFLQSLYRAFMETDASLLEINPCVVTGDGRVQLDDFATFAVCYLATSAYLPPDCAAASYLCADFNGDGIVNLSDFATFSTIFGQLPNNANCNW